MLSPESRFSYSNQGFLDSEKTLTHVIAWWEIKGKSSKLSCGQSLPFLCQSMGELGSLCSSLGRLTEKQNKQAKHMEDGEESTDISSKEVVPNQLCQTPMSEGNEAPAHT